MIPRRSSPPIACPIGLFESCEREIERLRAAINHTSAPEEKSRLTHELLENAATLLACKAYDQNSVNCRLCGDFSTLRHMTATVIDKATALRR